MIIVIDTDLMRASLTNSSCKQMMAEVLEERDTLRIAVDDKGVMIDEYYEFLEQNIEDAETNPAIKLLQDALLLRVNPMRQIMLPLPTEMPKSLENALEKHKCKTPIEPQLLAIAVNAKNLGLKLLLAGNTGIRLRHRGLNDPQVRRALRKEIPWLDVHFATDRKPLFAPSLIMHEKARTFELMVGLKLQTQIKNLCCVETPAGVKSLLKKQEDIDLYGYEYKEEGNTLIVWVGECKLREEGKEKSKPITAAELNQLRLRMEVATQYENSRTDLAAQTVQIKGLMISNAEGFFDHLARHEAQKMGVELWIAKLTSGWMSDQHWYIHELSPK